MNRRELKKLIKAHEIKQVCSVPENKVGELGLFGGAFIMYKYTNKDIYICVRWYWQWSSLEDRIIAKQDISESGLECFMRMHDELTKMHNNPDTVEAVHKLYIKCSDIMNDNYPGLHSMEDKICAKYVRKACDFFIHDRRYHQ